MILRASQQQRLTTRSISLLVLLLVPTSAALAAENGTWTPFRHPYSGHSAIHDPVRNRVVVFGGRDAHYVVDEAEGPIDGTYALSLTGAQEWTKLTTQGTPPLSRRHHTAIYDPLRDRMIIFGGYRGGYPDDVWALSLSGTPTWTRLVASGSPGREKHSAIYDPIRDRMLVFGGKNNLGNRNDVYELTLSGTPTWTQLSIPTPLPTARQDHSAIYDPVRDRMVIYGGSSGNTQVWSLKLAGAPTWTQLAPTGSPPQGRYGHEAVYDPSADRMVVFGGRNNTTFLNDSWQMALASPAWSPIAPSGTAPSPRYDHTAVHDATAGRMIVLGGGNDLVLGGGSELHGFALALTGSPAWSTVGTINSFPRQGYHSAVWDVAGGRMIVFASNQTWQLAMGTDPTWTPLAPAGAPPISRYSHSAIMDPVRNRMIVFGGQGGPSGFLNDVWELSLGSTPTWAPLTPGGTPPAARYGHGAFYDPSRDRMIVFGGTSGGLRNDVWALSLSGSPTWTQLSPGGTPPSGRADAGVIYDPVRDRMLVFGGSSPTGYTNDVWQLTLVGTPAWSQLAPAGSPPWLRATPAIYDPVRDRMVFFGGHSTPSPENDTWSLELAGTPTWVQLGGTTGPYPSERVAHTVVYDRLGDRMILYGGDDGATVFGLPDTHVLQWSSPATGPESQIAPMILEFGQTTVGTTASRNVVITNLGSSALSVSGIASANGTVTANPTAFVLAPAESRNVTVQWAPVASGPLTATLVVSSNDPGQPTQSIAVSGTAGATITADPTSFHVTLAPDQSTTRTLRLDNVDAIPRDFMAGPVTSGPGATIATASPGDGPGVLRAGGPDGFGYVFSDSDEPGGPAFGWIDVRTIGTQIPASGDDDNAGPFPIGFLFPFYGNTFTTFRVCTNGWISFTNSALTTYTNGTLPDAGAPSPENLLAVFWDDLDFTGTPRAWYHSNSSRLVIQFQDVTRVAQPGAPNTFEVVLNPDGTITYQYLSMASSDLASSTIGLQNGTRDQGLEVNFDAPYIHNGLAIRFDRPAETFLTVIPQSGSIGAGGHADLTVTFNSAGLSDGDYPGTIRIQSPGIPTVDVPCLLTVATPVGVPGATVNRFGLRLAGANPFEGSARLELAVPRRGEVAVRVFDLRGALIREIARREIHPGTHPVEWDGRNAAGNLTRAGVYFVQATGPDGRLDLRIVRMN